MRLSCLTQRGRLWQLPLNSARGGDELAMAPSALPSEKVERAEQNRRWKRIQAIPSVMGT